MIYSTNKGTLQARGTPRSSEQKEIIGKMTNWERNQWARGGYKANEIVSAEKLAEKYFFPITRKGR